MNDSKLSKPHKEKNKYREDLVKVQNELKRVYENYLELFDNAPIGYITLDNTGAIKAANKFTFQILKLNKYDLLGEPFSKFISKEATNIYYETLKKSFKKSGSLNCELKLENSAGEYFYVNMTVCSVLNKGTKTKESKITIIDITKLKNTEEKVLFSKNNFEGQLDIRTKELEASNKMLLEVIEKAEDINRIKSFFLANMSHELRTPMVGILGFSEVIMAETKEPDIKEMAALIRGEGTRLLETLNLILDFSKIESEKIYLNCEYADVNEIVKDVVNIFSVTIQKKNLVIEYKSENKVINANIDTRIFKQIIYNLVNNALKYTNQGFVEVSLYTNSEKLILKVKDTGIGIEKDNIGLIFEEFRQISEGYNRKFSGTGLGLTLTKRFIELMNGTISVISEVNKGTEFTVELPIAPNEAENNFLYNSFDGMKALIVEDDEVAYSLLKNIINDLCEADIATNLQDAMNKASEYLYDFIIMDINLGGEDTGIDVTRELRTIEGYNNVPIIAVTAYAMKGDKNFFINSGLDAYVSKPFTRTELIDTIKRSIENISQ